MILHYKKWGQFWLYCLLVVCSKERLTKEWQLKQFLMDSEILKVIPCLNTSVRKVTVKMAPLMQPPVSYTLMDLEQVHREESKAGVVSAFDMNSEAAGWVLILELFFSL